MFSPIVVFITVLVYLGAIYSIALWVERSPAGRRLAASPVVYALSLAIYCTSWTFFGSVGLAVRSGLLFFTFYLGSILTFAFGWSIIRKMVRIKNTHRITSIADFLSARYGKSQLLASLVTCGALIGSLPYISLQIKSVTSTFQLLVSSQSTLAAELAGPFSVIIMIVFTLVFGVRRIDPTERHPGIITAVATESLVKLIAFLVIGITVCFVLFDGPRDIFSRAAVINFSPLTGLSEPDSRLLLPAMSYVLMSMVAVLLLPRQFHVAVVENFNEEHIKTARWLFPFYMVLITLFVLPIAAGGLLLGLPSNQGDTFVLQIPLLYGHPWLAIVAYLGGLSAAMSMIMICAMTLATMTTNHLLLPLVAQVPALNFLKRSLLQCRWAAVALVIICSYWFSQTVGQTYILARIGMISFAAVLQFAPATIGALYWRRATKSGAILGIVGGFFIWFYTLLLPALLHSTMAGHAFLTDGPFGLTLFRPEQLFGIGSLDSISHTVLWSMLLNSFLFTTGSIFLPLSKEEKWQVQEFLPSKETPEHMLDLISGKRVTPVYQKSELLHALFLQYFKEAKAEELTRRCLQESGLQDQFTMTLLELANLQNVAEKILSGFIGAAAAHQAVAQSGLFSPVERDELSKIYTETISRLNLDPRELIKRIDYYHERADILEQHALELELEIQQKEKEIGERKKAEQALRITEEKYRSIFENAVEGLFQSTLEGKFLSVNPAMAEILGYDSPEDLVASVHDIKQELYVEPQMRDQLLLLKEKKEELLTIETQFRRKDGTITWCIANVRPIFSKVSGEFLFFEGSFVDITRRKEALEELKQYREHLEELVEERTTELKRANSLLQEEVETRRKIEQEKELILNATTDLVMYHTPDLKVLWANRAAAESVHLSLEDLKDRFCYDIWFNQSAPCSYCPVIKARNTGQPQKGEIQWPDGRQWLVRAYPVKDDRGELLGIVELCQDVTGQKRAEEELIRSKKLESVAELAGGIAHDFNNILTVVLGNLNLTRTTLGPGEEGMQYLAKAEQYIFKAQTLTQRFLTFSTGGDPVKKIEPMAALIKGAADLALSGSRIRCTHHLQDQLWSAQVDPNQINQALINIIDNAKESMSSGGTIQIHAENSTLTQPVRESGMALDEGEYVHIMIIDEGPGIPEEILPKIFDPYFTTKEWGAEKGKGLGLAVAHSVIKKHDGGIRVESKMGEGTAIHIYLPAVPVPAPPPPEKETTAGRQVATRILVMDDESQLLELAQASLEALGFEVVTAENGEQAIDLYNQAQDEGRPIDTVLLDLTVAGGMGGEEALVRIQETNPTVRAIVTSGYADDPVMADCREHGFVAALPKPYTLDELKTIMQQVLGAKE